MRHFPIIYQPGPLCLPPAHPAIKVLWQKNWHASQEYAIAMTLYGCANSVDRPYGVTTQLIDEFGHGARDTARIWAADWVPVSAKEARA